MFRSIIRVPVREGAGRIWTTLRALATRSGRLGTGFVLAALTGLPAPGATEMDLAPQQGLGLPFARFYSFEEVGNVSRGVQLGFDPLGRITVTRGGSCIVLNDTAWIDIADKEANNAVMQRLVFGPDGNAYYGAFGSWGVARMENGKLRPSSLVPASLPKWVASSNFREIVPVDTGVYFAGSNGVVYWERATNRTSFFELPYAARIFVIGQTPYVVSLHQGIFTLDVARQSVVRLQGLGTDETEIDQVTPFDGSRVLLSTIRGKLLFFDGTRFTPFPGVLGTRAHGRISSMLRLVDGNIAVAINGAGLYVVTETGQVYSSLTTSEYHRVTDLAAHENGVLWIVNETGIEKILYNSPLTVFGQRQGLPVSWPQISRWDGRIVVASGGQLYQTVSGAPGESTRFQLMPDQPGMAAWGLAVADRQLLVGTNQGVFVRQPDGRFEQVLENLDVARLVAVQDIVYVLGLTEIAALRQVDGRWTECAPRVPGVGYPLVVHGTNHAAWMELGPNRAGRVRYHEGRLQVRVFEDFPWKNPHWINIGFVGDTVALSGMPEGRIFFDEQTERLSDRHPLGNMLDRSPYPVTRFRQDGEGTIWATHDTGLLTIRMRDGQAVIDTTTFGKINDRFPLIHLLPDGDAWLTTGQSLYHVNRHLGPAAKPHFKPTLVSLTNGRTGRELLTRPGVLGDPPRLPHEENNLVLRFFAGTYASRNPPVYEFRLHRGGSSWEPLGNGSLLTLTDLREGEYRLEARMSDSMERVGETLALEFVIASPWYRTWYAYCLYVLIMAVFIYGLVRWSAHQTISKNLKLEKLVTERTNELRVAMRQLNEETRNAATLAERDRLAGEIHDSLQQGLSGLMLHLDATLKLPDLPGDIRSRLSVARNMVSFTRHEVQHAVWDMETPLLEDTELGEALKKITALIGPGAAKVHISVSGRPAELTSATKHHLLRIAQEAITNAVRHAAARTITIALAYEPAGVSLSVADDGNGFVPSEVLANGIGHFGLRGLRGRAGKIGGELHIASVPGRGTTVRVTVKTPAPAYAHDR